MNHSLAKRALTSLFIFFLLLTVLACSCSALNGILPATSQSGSQTGQVSAQENLTFGSGTFILSDPKVGLSDLSSYTALLTLSFDGTINGQPSKWSKKYVMLASKVPSFRQLTVDTSTVTSSNPDPVFIAELDGADYVVNAQNECSASAIEQGSSLSDRFEPAGFLHYVIGATAAGNETVNDVGVNHYKFDQFALGQQKLTQSTGELWVASSGGYVVKYLLTTNAKADYFGTGIEGALTWDYELTGVGKPVSVQLPTYCPGGLVNVPQLSNTSNVVNTPGALTYDTSTSLSDAVAFYQKQIPALGWQLQGNPDVSDTQAFMNFQQAGQSLIIFISADAGITSVVINLVRTQK
ncbi:MAG: hypothetical protein ABSA23_05160 [Anaerolineales bacterium]|jgi:hypothetical protein